MRLAAHLSVVVLLWSASQAQAQANGKLQIHYMDVGHGDAAVLVSPLGEVVLFDDGVLNQCGKPVAYLQQAGITGIDYHVASHYHSDHIGCAPNVLSAFPLRKAAYDRGGSYTTAAYTAYVNAVGARRRTAVKGQTITLDAASANPVTITFVGVSGNGAPTSGEHDLGLVALVRFGQFQAVFGGDVSGAATGAADADPTALVTSSEATGRLPYSPAGAPASYADIESTLGALVGTIEVYKVHQHGSTSSSNAAWLAATTPKVGILSVGNANSFAQPAVETMTRLHNAGVKTYWTSAGNGAAPVAGRDVVAGDVIVSVDPGATTFSVTHGATTDVFADWGFSLPGAGLPAAPPFGSFDTPAPGSTVTGEVGITGWALDNSGVTGIDIYRGPLAGEPVQANGMVFIGTATRVTGARPDIASTYGAYPGSDSAGWGYMLLSNMLPNHGNGTFTIAAYVRTVDGANSLLGSRSITLVNATSDTPFGTIDTPAQGQTVSGTILNWGWALTPNAAGIPIDGSTIDVYVDGVLRGHPSYNHYRSDIATLFPGYFNSDGAVGYFTLDTTTLMNGVHSIAWVVRDAAGQASGIGSRYFSVQNAGTINGVTLYSNRTDPGLARFTLTDGTSFEMFGPRDATGQPTALTTVLFHDGGAGGRLDFDAAGRLQTARAGSSSFTFEWTSGAAGVMTAYASGGTRVEAPLAAPSVISGEASSPLAFAAAAAPTADAVTGDVAISVTECGNLTSLPADVSVRVLGNAFTANGTYPAVATGEAGRYVATLPKTDPNAGQKFTDQCSKLAFPKDATDTVCHPILRLGSTGGSLEAACMLAGAVLFPVQPEVSIIMMANCDKAAKFVETTCRVMKAIPNVCSLVGDVVDRAVTGQIDLEPIVTLHTLTGPRSLGGELYRQSAPATGPFPAFTVDFAGSSAACTQSYAGAFTLRGPHTCLSCGGPPYCSDTLVYEFTNVQATFPSFQKGTGSMSTMVQQRLERGVNSCYQGNMPTFDPYPCSYPLTVTDVGGTIVTNPAQPGVWPLLPNSLSAQKNGVTLSGSFSTDLPLIGYTASLSGPITLRRTPTPLSALQVTTSQLIAATDALMPDALTWPDGAILHRVDAARDGRVDVRLPAAWRGQPLVVRSPGGDSPRNAWVDGGGMFHWRVSGVAGAATTFELWNPETGYALTLVVHVR